MIMIIIIIIIIIIIMIMIIIIIIIIIIMIIIIKTLLTRVLIRCTSIFHKDLTQHSFTAITTIINDYDMVSMPLLDMR